MAKTVYHQLLVEATQQDRQQRVNLLKQLGEHYDRDVLAFYTSFNAGGSIADEDVGILHDLLYGMAENGKKLLLIINSPGGDPLAAERFVKVCREFSENDYWVIIPGMAKSAATIITFGSTKWFMTPTSELGPIDMQVAWKEDLVPASLIIKSYNDLMEKGMNLAENQRIEPVLQQLQHFDAPNIEWMIHIRDLSEEIAKKILKGGMFANVPATEVSRLLKKFIDPMELKTHGRPIFYSDIRDIDKKGRFMLDLLDPTDDIHRVIHEYHLRLLNHMGKNNTWKALETAEDFFRAPTHIGGGNG